MTTHTIRREPWAKESDSLGNQRRDLEAKEEKLLQEENPDPEEILYTLRLRERLGLGLLSSPLPKRLLYPYFKLQQKETEYPTGQQDPLKDLERWTTQFEILKDVAREYLHRGSWSLWGGVALERALRSIERIPSYLNEYRTLSLEPSYWHNERWKRLTYTLIPKALQYLERDLIPALNERPIP